MPVVYGIRVWVVQNVKCYCNINYLSHKSHDQKSSLSQHNELDSNRKLCIFLVPLKYFIRRDDSTSGHCNQILYRNLLSGELCPRAIGTLPDASARVCTYTNALRS